VHTYSSVSPTLKTGGLDRRRIGKTQSFREGDPHRRWSAGAIAAAVQISLRIGSTLRSICNLDGAYARAEYMGWFKRAIHLRSNTQPKCRRLQISPLHSCFSFDLIGFT